MVDEVLRNNANHNHNDKNNDSLGEVVHFYPVSLAIHAETRPCDVNLVLGITDMIESPTTRRLATKTSMNCVLLTAATS